MSPPSTDCSASIEWGGRRSPSPEPPGERLLTRTATNYACAARLGRPLLFGDDRYGQRHIDVRMQVQLDLVLARRADRPGRHAHFGTHDRVARIDRRFGDIGRADRSEQLAFGAGFGLDLEFEVLEVQ